ncbi:MAG: histidine--tRNA ligase [Clostridia bacterium]|nr:histidine--tRNA ligase [Clostridia bacterium]
MALEIKAPRGTNDVLPADSYKWQMIEDAARRVAQRFGYREIRFPTFESTELFERGVGDTTDVVQKEMYTFKDKGDRSVTLRPEGTASAVRVCLEHGLFGGLMPLKAYYLISAFRYEKPQAGRFREFHQFGAELYGSSSPQADREVIELAASFLRELGLDRIALNINSIGCPECRKNYHQALKEYFSARAEELCETCRGRLERNPMRILDCKSPICKEIAAGAPLILDYLCDDCKEHFEILKKSLTDGGIEFHIDPHIVRGLDYYTRTVFEFTDPDSGLALAGGGRYDGLVSELDSKMQVCGLGFAAGLERLVGVMQERGLFPEPAREGAYIATMGQNAVPVANKLASELRKLGIRAETDLMNRSVKAQMKYADKTNSRFAVVIGDSEVESGTVTVKDMAGGEPFEAALSEAAKAMAERI